MDEFPCLQGFLVREAQDLNSREDLLLDLCPESCGISPLKCPISQLHDADTRRKKGIRRGGPEPDHEIGIRILLDEFA